MQEYYKILGVNEESTLEEVTIRFNKLLVEFDPNKQSEDLKDFFANEQKKLREAYKQISLTLTKKEELEQAKDEYQEVSEDTDIETKICEKCGKKVHIKAVLCVGCGCALTADPFRNQNQLQKSLPNEVGTLICGILSLVFLSCYLLPGLILALVTFLVSSKDNQLLKDHPNEYLSGNHKAGRICAKISIWISLLFFFIILIAFIFSYS